MTILLENVVWGKAGEHSAVLAFHMSVHGKLYMIATKDKTTAAQLLEMRKGLRICVAFSSGGANIDIWKGLNGRYRIVYTCDNAILVDGIVTEQEIGKLYEGLNVFCLKTE